MPSRTLEDRVAELTKITATLQTQVDSLDGAVGGIDSDVAELHRAISELKTNCAVLNEQINEFKAWRQALGPIGDLRIDIALHKRDLDELNKWKEETKKEKQEWDRKV